MPRRRLSSDGYKLFKMAYSPEPSRVRELFACFMRSEYDDKLDLMTEKCEKASRQLFAYNTDPIKKDRINKFIDNSIFNIVYAILCKDGELTNKFNIKRNYRYFSDVMINAFNNAEARPHPPHPNCGSPNCGSPNCGLRNASPFLGCDHNLK